jgi:hypothetical protein
VALEKKASNINADLSGWPCMVSSTKKG